MIFKRSLIAELANLAGAVFTVLFTIVLAVAMVRFLNMAAGGSIEHGTVVQLVLYNALVNLPPLLAASLFIATLMTLMRSWQDNEMVVWFSSGGRSILSWIEPTVKFALPIVVVIALLAIVISSPFLLVIAVAIKLYDGGPVFYKQERLTRDRETFQIIKFRSMKVDSEKQGAQLAKKDDDRITPVGKIIRRTHLDELPQIFNILKGEMSFVGPRPERQEIAEKYEEIVPEFRFRLKVKAGLTGYAQVYGKYNTTPYDKLKLDLTYIQTYSAWLDVKLMLMTFKIMFQKENTEGVDEKQTTAIKKES